MLVCELACLGAWVFVCVWARMCVCVVCCSDCMLAIGVFVVLVSFMGLLFCGFAFGMCACLLVCGLAGFPIVI